MTTKQYRSMNADFSEPVAGSVVSITLLLRVVKASGPRLAITEKANSVNLKKRIVPIFLHEYTSTIPASSEKTA